MRRDDFPWFISFGICILLIILSLMISWFVVRNRLDTSRPLQDMFINLSPGKTVSQNFTPLHDFVNIIILQFKNPGLANRGEYRFVLKSEKGEPIIERAFSGYNIGDPNQIRFQFDPIQHSRGKNFTITVETVSANEPYIGIGASENGDLYFSTYYRTVNKKAALIDLLNDFTRKTLGDKTFFVPWGLLLFFLAGIGIKQIRKA